jgi:hypothetical protein
MISEKLEQLGFTVTILKKLIVATVVKLFQGAGGF